MCCQNSLLGHVKSFLLCDKVLILLLVYCLGVFLVFFSGIVCSIYSGVMPLTASI